MKSFKVGRTRKLRMKFIFVIMGYTQLIPTEFLTPKYFRPWIWIRSLSEKNRVKILLKIIHAEVNSTVLGVFRFLAPDLRLKSMERIFEVCLCRKSLLNRNMIRETADIVNNSSGSLHKKLSRFFQHSNNFDSVITALAILLWNSHFP